MFMSKNGRITLTEPVELYREVSNFPSSGMLNIMQMRA